MTGLPPLVRRRGANVTWETNSFSVAKLLKSGPYSLSSPHRRLSSFLDGFPFLRVLHRRWWLIPNIIAFHLGPLPQDLLVVIGDPLPNRLVHLQRLLQTEHMILSPMPARLLGNLLLAFAAAWFSQFRQLPCIPFSTCDRPQNRSHGTISRWLVDVTGSFNPAGLRRQS